MTDSPYKFLDAYAPADAELFFGRDLEIKALMSDVLLSKLIVLFARTGTGKTSLIRAGLIPRLEKKGYRTLFIRVNKDPIASARLEFAPQLRAENVAGATFAEQLEELSRKILKAPLVVFFDQFEEFFLHVRDPAVRRQFVDDIARVYCNRELGVHVVLSMREEFFIELDEFRTKIPTIFHNDSNLRLRWFDRNAATEAIVNPARARAVEFHPALLDRLLSDLTKRERIEPAYLQIVCDTLWQRKQNGSITLDVYKTFDQDAREPNVARQIVNQRLEREFDSLTSAAQLRLLEKLLPELRTRRNTKHLKDMDRLVRRLKTDRATLAALLEDLKKTRLIQEVKFGDVVTIQLAHDYLAETRRLRFLRDRVRVLWLRRLRDEGQLVSPSDLSDILNNVDSWRFDREQTELLFRSSLTNASQVVRQWHEIAVNEGVDVTRILREALQKDRQSAVEAIDLLRELEEEWAVNLLMNAIHRHDLVDETRDALRSLTRARDPRIAAIAQRGLAITEDFAPGLPEHHFKGERPPYSVIASRLREGKVIPFLGSSVTADDRGPDEVWKFGESRFLPTPAELARHLAQEINFPGKPPFNLAEVAQYYAVYAGGSRLGHLLQEIYSAPSAPTRLHTFIAQQRAPLLILTTNYDNLLEKAFEAEGRPYGLLMSSAEPELRGGLLWQEPGSTEMQAVQPNRLDIRPEASSIIYKLYGSANSYLPRKPNYCITEDDHIEFLAQLIRNRTVPPVLAEPLTTRPFLFIGYGLNDWTQRTLLSCFERQVLRRSSWSMSWAVRSKPTAAEARFWRQRRIEVFDVPLAEFTEELEVTGG